MRALVQALNHQRTTIDQLSFNVTQGLERTLQHRRLLQARIQQFNAETEARLANPPAAARVTDHPRLSMPLPDSDGSSEPDLSVLGMARPGVVPDQNIEDISYGDEDDEEILSHEQYEAEETSVEEEEEEEEEEHESRRNTKLRLSLILQRLA